MSAPVEVRIVEAVFGDALHRASVVDLLDGYARDLMGGGEGLRPEVRARLVPALEQQPTALVLLAFAAERAVGIAVGFWGFSTFQAMPLLNLHDLAVVPELRGRGIGRALLAAVEARARARGCCKLTLEVLENNRTARGLYQSFGFEDYVLGSSGPARFLSKSLSKSP